MTGQLSTVYLQCPVSPTHTWPTHAEVSCPDASSGLATETIMHVKRMHYRKKEISSEFFLNKS